MRDHDESSSLTCLHFRADIWIGIISEVSDQYSMGVYRHGDEAIVGNDELLDCGFLIFLELEIQVR